MRDDESPDTLHPDTGVSRLNKRPLALVVVILGAVVFALTYGILGKNRRIQAKPAEQVEKHLVADSSAAAAALARNAPKAGPIPEKPRRFKSAQKGGLIVAAAETAKPAEPIATQPDSLLEQRRRFAAKREQLFETALTAGTRVGTLDDLPNHGSHGGKSIEAAGFATPIVEGVRSSSGSLSAIGAKNDDPNGQSEKANFAEQKRSLGYLAGTRQPPLSQFEIKAGTVIPAVLISGVNSDLPGQIIAQVTQNVYDTATGNYLLVPQGAKLVGVYDSRIAVGQSRVQVAWTRLNFPDSSTLELGNMPGTDPSGYGGFNDKTNNHVIRIFGDALMLSLISAGTQLSQPQTRSANGEATAQQQISAAMGQQFGAAGLEMTKRNMDIQPTLEIRPGYEFAVMVNKDVVLQPYTERSAP